jgi:hypothetical protein
LVVRLRLWQPWPPFRISTEPTSLDTLFISISVNSQFIYCAGLQQTPSLAWSTHFTPTLTGPWNVALEGTTCLCNSALDLNTALKSEIWNTIWCS